MCVLEGALARKQRRFVGCLGLLGPRLEIGEDGLARGWDGRFWGLIQLPSLPI